MTHQPDCNRTTVGVDAFAPYFRHAKSGLSPGQVRLQPDLFDGTSALQTSGLPQNIINEHVAAWPRRQACSGPILGDGLRVLPSFINPTPGRTSIHAGLTALSSASGFDASALSRGQRPE